MTLIPDVHRGSFAMRGHSVRAIKRDRIGKGLWVPRGMIHTNITNIKSLSIIELTTKKYYFNFYFGGNQVCPQEVSASIGLEVKKI